MTYSWTSLIPPLCVLASTLLIQNLKYSLIIGITIASLILHHGNLGLGIQSMATHVYDHITDPSRLYLYAFLITISILITVFNATGSAIAFARAMTARLRTKRMTETSTVGLLCALFIDDYLNVLTVGYVMRPITDRVGIARAKLAFLIHSLSGPLVILAPISSWVAVITTQLDQAGVSPLIHPSTTIIGESFILYVQTIPFIFYSLILIGALFFIIHRRISFGPMYTHEDHAQKTGNLLGGRKDPDIVQAVEDIESHGERSRALDLVAPLAILVGGVIVGILYFGGYHLLGGTRSFLEAAMHNTESELVLFLAGSVALVTSLMLAVYRHTLTQPQLVPIVRDGINLIIPSIIIVICATIFGRFLSQLHTGDYIATTFLQHTPLALLPFILFITSTSMALITGSSWGTMAILIPISIQMLLSLVPFTQPVSIDSIPLLFPILGAIFSGAVCGNHISPLAETTVMAATSSGSHPLDHIKTQLPYALIVIVSSCCAFICAGFLMPFGKTISLIAALGTGLTICFALLSVFNYLRQKKYGK